MDRRDALKGMVAAGVAAPILPAADAGPHEAFCPERLELWGDWQAWLGAREPGDYPTEIDIRETDVPVSYGSCSWKYRASATVWRDDATPRVETADGAEHALAALFKAGELPAGLWLAIKDRPFWAIRLHDGWLFYQTDTDGAYYTFRADGAIQPHKGAPKHLPQ